MRKKQILCMLMGVLISMNSYAQVNLIPFPQKVIYGNSNFTIDENTKIVASSLDSFYVNQLLTSVKQELGVTLNWVKKARSKQIEFIKVPTPDKYKAILKSNSLDSDFNIGTEGYVINITPQTIQIISQSDAGVFYGIQTLKQLLIANRVGNNIPCMVIYDYPDMPVRAWQDDISRGPIPTMGMLKLQIEKMASYKLNYFSLYIEHVFKLDKHPGIAPKDGISKAEIEELSAFAEKYHVNLVGSYQSFGHMEKTLAHPNYQHLAETDHIISPALDESYEFLSDVYQEIVPTFSGDYFNINCDETFGLGEGKSKSMVDRLGIDGVYLFHINKLNTILKQYDKKVLMWGDIITDYPLIINQLPKDITVIAWGYHAADNFESTIMPFYKSGANFWVAPGVNCWSNIFPNFKETQVNIYNLIRDGHKYKATGVFNTTWDDDGLNFFHNNWHGLIWGAENSWNTPDYKSSIEESNNARKIRYNAFNQAFDAIFYGLESDSIIADIIAFSNLHQSGVRDVLKNSRFFEPIFPIHLEYVKKGKKQDNLQLLIQLDELNNRIESVIPKIKQNRITIDYLKFAIRQVQFTLHKNIFRINLSHFMKNEEEVTTSEIKKGIQDLIEKATLLKTEYIVLWNQENREHWLEKNIQKFDEFIESLANLEGYCVISPSITISEKGREIAMKSLFGDLPVYYSTEKDAVESSFIKYVEPIFCNSDVSIKARVINKDKAFEIKECNLIYHKAIGKLHTLNAKYSKYHPSYDGGGTYALLDGKQGTADALLSGKWQGYAGQNIDIEIDLERSQSINYFSMGFYQNTRSWVIFPKKIEIYVKDSISDSYKLIKIIDNTIPPEAEGSLKHIYETKFTNLKVRYVKVIAHYYGKLPEWHHAGSNYESMIFSDEIILK